MSGAFECATLQYYTGLRINLVTKFDDSSVLHALGASAHTSGRSVRLQGGQCPLTGRVLARLRLSGLLGYRSGLPERTALDGEKLFAIHVHNSSYLTFHI